MTRREALRVGMSALGPCAQAAGTDQPQRREFVSPHMGTLWRLVFFDDDERRARDARDAAWALVEAHEQALSDYRDDSEVNKLCRAGELGPVSQTLDAVLRQSCVLAEETGGAFDPTVGPLVRLWRASRKSGFLPPPDVVAEARSRVGWQKILLRREGSGVPAGAPGVGGTWALTQAGMQLDFGGIAKGFTQEAVLRLLREKYALTRALIDAGGGVAVGDPPPGASGWRIGLAEPDQAGATQNEAVVFLANQSLATSGDAHQFVEIGGVRYSHIVDPATGLGLTKRIQASVITAQGASADGFATAFCVMGEAKVRAFLQHRPSIVARVLTTAGNGRTRIWESKGFDRLTDYR